MLLGTSGQVGHTAAPQLGHSPGGWVTSCEMGSSELDFRSLAGDGSGWIQTAAWMSVPGFSFKGPFVVLELLFRMEFLMVQP